MRQRHAMCPTVLEILEDRIVPSPGDLGAIAPAPNIALRRVNAAAPAPKPVGRAYGVGIAENVILYDSSRAKSLPVKVYYPLGRASFPIVIFSHGLGGSKNTFPALSLTLASNGYVVIHPTHEDLDLLAGSDETLGSVSWVSEPSVVGDRPRDISFIIDSIGSIRKSLPGFQGRMNASRIGVSGASLGAYTAALKAGVLVASPGQMGLQSYADPRVRAVVLISPQGVSERWGLSQPSWSQVRIPMMTITGTRDLGLAGEPLEWRAQPFELSPPGNKYHIIISGASHFSLTFENPTVAPYTNAATLAFWNATLKQQRRDRVFLKSGGLSSQSGGYVAQMTR